jgi:MFS family permease
VDLTTRRLIVSRAVRGFADGFASVLLGLYLTDLGFSGRQSGAIVTATLIGSAALTLWVGTRIGRRPARSILMISCALMAATGVGFASATRFWPIMLVGFVGTLNPSGGDVSLFLPIEQALIADGSDAARRPSLFARYNLAGAGGAALGALASTIPHTLDQRRWSFLVYVAASLVSAAVYRSLPAVTPNATPRGRLDRSRPVVFKLAALFSLDSAAGGLAVTSLIVVYLHRRFDLDATIMGATLAVMSLLGAGSQLVSARLAPRLGLVRTMVFTHVPANVFLIAAGLAPHPALAVGALLVRSTMMSMDVPVRQALVMAVVEPSERAAAAAVTNVPRSLATASTPVLAGWLLDRSVIGWPLVIAGAAKIVYDLLLLQAGRRLVVPDPD